MDSITDPIVPKIEAIEASDAEPCEGDGRIRRPMNAFMIFGQKNRKILSQKFEQLSNKEISKLLGEEWRKMDTQTKDHYKTLANELHRQHMDKHPDYYYSPLEARQRKAAKKRRLRMSATHQHKPNHQISVPFGQTFIGNRPLLFRNICHPMMRPMFRLPIHPGIRFAQNFYRFPPNYPFGGLVTYPVPPVFQRSDESLRNDFIDTKQTPQSLKVKEEVEDVVQFNDIQEPKPSKSSDMGLLSSYLPPMHNPSIEVTPVLQNEELVSKQNSMIGNEVTKMVNAVVVSGDQPFDSSEDLSEVETIVADDLSQSPEEMNASEEQNQKLVSN